MNPTSLDQGFLIWFLHYSSLNPQRQILEYVILVHERRSEPSTAFVHHFVLELSEQIRVLDSIPVVRILGRL